MAEEPQESQPAFISGQQAAIEWLKSLPEYQAIKSRRDLKNFIPSPPNLKLTKYLFKLIEQRIHQITDSPSEGYKQSLLDKWKDDIGNPPGLHKFSLGFIFKIHNLVQMPIACLVTEVRSDTALRDLWKVLGPAIARYRRSLQQLKNDPLLKRSPAIKDFLSSFYESALFVLNNCAPRVSELSRIRIKYGISKPLDSPPHRQQIFDKMLVDLVDYLRDRISNQTGKKSKLFKHVSKILSLAWGAKLCPDNPKMWQTRYRREKGIG